MIFQFLKNNWYFHCAYSGMIFVLEMKHDALFITLSREFKLSDGVGGK